jgi:hypothetical protein
MEGEIRKIIQMNKLSQTLYITSKRIGIKYDKVRT